ncbi:ABC1 atypical kinase-like domain [Popillia japonica]|uniref:ABC1 atypical kinase-like domain n=1 Tax=Popillia japonica TaxID=7064 RepID=A0AAW1L8F1_POPJA
MTLILIIDSVMTRKTKELIGLIRGMQSVVEAGVKLQEESLKPIWDNSSVKALTKECYSKNAQAGNLKSFNGIGEFVSESTARINTVLYGIRVFADYPTVVKNAEHRTASFKTSEDLEQLRSKEAPTSQQASASSIVTATKVFEIKLTDSDKALLKKLDMEHREKIEIMKKQDETSNIAHVVAVDVKEEKKKEKKAPKIVAVPNPKSRQSLSTSSKQRTVPSSRISRMASFGSLAAGLGLGTLAEYTRRTLGIGEPAPTSNPLLTEANMERIVDTLCKVRGAALKLGQILSIQDDTVINPQLAKALERVRKSADFMPLWQLEKVMNLELSYDWRNKYEEFDDKPFAAASIGEVHRGKLKTGQEVAIKIQYPGVAKGIESDIDNLFGVMKLWNLFPEGMFVDNLVLVAKRELAWEVDYVREAECTRKFKKLLQLYPDYYVPAVVDDLTTKQVFTSELVEGIPVDQCVNLEIEHRRFIASKLVELILRELLEFRFMQTDPNWANFLYNPETKKLLLLDFGASREYSKEFVEQYVKIIKAAADDDRQTVLEVSKEIGFLTGYESKLMEKAHVEGLMIIGEIFKYEGEFDFSKQNATERLQNLVPTIITHRLCPPPEEIYSLHRKLSGIFLLCIKLNATVPVRKIFLDLYKKYEASK